MKILIGIPVVLNAELFDVCVASVVDKLDVGVLIVDNGSEPKVKDVINRYSQKSNVVVITNETNAYVNPAWNQMIDFFIKSDYDYLCLMNSDLVLQKDWDIVLRNRWAVNEDEIIIPIVADKNVSVSTEWQEAARVDSGTAGIFITLNKVQALAVYPIPSDILVWFGDNWIYELLRGVGYKTVIPPNFIASHAWSSTVSKIKGVGEIIEQDKKAWNEKVSILLQEKINNYGRSDLHK